MYNDELECKIKPREKQLTVPGWARSNDDDDDDYDTLLLIIAITVMNVLGFMIGISLFVSIRNHKMITAAQNYCITKLQRSNCRTTYLHKHHSIIYSGF